MTENGFNSSQNAFVPCSFSCGYTSDHFGPEVGIAYEYAKQYPEEEIFIIKYAFGATTLDDQWLDGNGNRGELYNAAMSFSSASLSYLTSCGYEIALEGICWMQGENDSCEWKYTKSYQKNTENIISYFQDDLSDYGEDIPFIDAKISNNIIWPYHSIINRAKTNATAKYKNAICLDTVKMGLTTYKEPKRAADLAHYDSESMIKLGCAFADSLIKIQTDK